MQNMSCSIDVRPAVQSETTITLKTLVERRRFGGIRTNQNFGRIQNNSFNRAKANFRKPDLG